MKKSSKKFGSIKARASRSAKVAKLKWCDEYSQKWLDSIQMVAGHFSGGGSSSSNSASAYYFQSSAQASTLSTTAAVSSTYDAMVWLMQTAAQPIVLTPAPAKVSASKTKTPAKAKAPAKKTTLASTKPVVKVHLAAAPSPAHDKEVAITNISGVWHVDSNNSKLTVDGGAGSMLCLSTAAGSHLVFGIMKVHPDTMAAFAVHITPQRTRSTPLIPLAKSDSYCLETDIDRKTGQTNVWVNDVGLDMGVLKALKGGAHSASFAVAASQPGDHLLSGRFTNCAIAKAGQWVAAAFDETLQGGNLALHHDVKIAAPNSLSCRDLRSSVA